MNLGHLERVPQRGQKLTMVIDHVSESWDGPPNQKSPMASLLRQAPMMPRLPPWPMDVFMVPRGGRWDVVDSLFIYTSVSKNSGTPNSSILIGFSIINHPFWGTTIFGNTHIYIYTYTSRNKPFPSRWRVRIFNKSTVWLFRSSNQLGRRNLSPAISWQVVFFPNFKYLQDRLLDRSTISSSMCWVFLCSVPVGRRF